jgi:PKD repeat protein
VSWLLENRYAKRKKHSIMKKPIAYILFAILLVQLDSLPLWGQDCANTPPWLPEKLRVLGGWDANGRPDYLDPIGDPADPELIEFIKENLPEAISLPERDETFFGENVRLNTVITKETDVYLTFVFEEAFLQNVLGFYTYPVGAEPVSLSALDSLVVIFPRVNSKEVLNSGDKVYLGKFPPNTVIGYFLIQQGWNNGTICAPGHIITSNKELNTFTSPANRQHTILLYYETQNKFLLSFEDVVRPSGDSDFNDASFYITADPGAIDTTDVPKVVEATISGDTTLCDFNAPASIRLDLKGIAPWKVVYNDGSRNIEINGITESPYIFQTTAKDTIRLVSVEDHKNIGIPRGQAIVRYVGIKAALREVVDACEGEPDGALIIALDGLAPMQLRYEENGVEKSVGNILDTLFTLNVPHSAVIRLLEVSNAYCSTELDVEATIGVRANPTATIRGTSPVCEGEGTAEVQLDLTGQSPWTVVYSLGTVRDTVTVADASAVIPLDNGGTFTLIWVNDAYCSSDADGSIEVTAYPKTSASLVSSNDICPGGEAIISIELTGAGPWNLSYRFKGAEQNIETDTSPLVLTFDEPGLFELTRIRDLNCDVPATGTAEIKSVDAPTAILSGPEKLCEGQTAALALTLTGAAPWNITYTDGTGSYEITATSADAAIEVAAEGTYSLIAVADANCAGTVEGEVTLTTVPLPTALLTASAEPPVVCGEEDEVLLRLELSGTGPWNLVIANGTSELNVVADASPFEFPVSLPGTYRIVSVSDAYCTGTGAGEVTVKDALDDLVAEIITDDRLCFGEVLDISVLVAEGVSYTLTTDGEGFLVQTGNGVYTYTAASEESGIIELILEVTNECGSKTVSREVMVVGELNTSFTTDPENPLSGETVQFIPANTEYDSYLWDFGDGNTSVEVSPTHVYETGGEFEVTLVVGLNGCENEGSQGLAVATVNQLYVPTAFNPSAIHPENRLVKVYGTNVSEDEFYFRIVNRWGKTMYETSSFTEANTSGWQGVNANTDELQDLNVFTWILRGKFLSGERFEKTGTVTKIK